jgi:hypothetical protein
MDISDTVLLEIGAPPKELESIIAPAVANPKKDMIVVDNEDFEVRFDLWGDTYRFNWIINRTAKYRGADIFHALITAVEMAYGAKPITTSAEKGYDEQAKKDLNGYYTMLRWGFIPDKGVKMFNALLGETYPTMEAAFKDSSFWKNWRDYGSSYTGVFDMTPGSLSWDLLEKKI